MRVFLSNCGISNRFFLVFFSLVFRFDQILQIGRLNDVLSQQIGHLNDILSQPSFLHIVWHHNLISRFYSYGRNVNTTLTRGTHPIEAGGCGSASVESPEDSLGQSQERKAPRVESRPPSRFLIGPQVQPQIERVWSDSKRFNFQFSPFNNLRWIFCVLSKSPITHVIMKPKRARACRGRQACVLRLRPHPHPYGFQEPRNLQL